MKILSALKSVSLKIKDFGKALWQRILYAYGQVYKVLPIVLVVGTNAFMTIAVGIMVYVVAHIQGLESAAGSAVTLELVIRSLTLVATSIGVYIAALRYAYERGKRSK